MGFQKLAKMNFIQFLFRKAQQAYDQFEKSESLSADENYLTRMEPSLPQIWTEQQMDPPKESNLILDTPPDVALDTGEELPRVS